MFMGAMHDDISVLMSESEGVTGSRSDEFARTLCCCFENRDDSS